MIAHSLKVLPNHFRDMINGSRKFDIRASNEVYSVGDTLELREWDGFYTGRTITKKVSYIAYANNLGPGCVVLGIE